MANIVMAGDYKGAGIACGFEGVIICKGFKRIKLNKSTVLSYELITNEHRKSAASGIGRGLIGGALLGPVGMIGGAVSAKNKSTYQISIQFKDGKRSLIEVDGTIYKRLTKDLF